MIKREKPMLDGPIPGQSLTSEPGARPWENPPKYATVEDTLGFYIDKLSDPKKMALMLDKIEEGAPLTLIADTLQTQGVSQGLHTLDVGVLIAPVLIEYMKSMAEQADVPYVTGIEEESVMNEEDEVMAKQVARSASAEPMAVVVAMEEQQKEMPTEKPSKGLMAPKRTEEVEGEA